MPTVLSEPVLASHPAIAKQIELEKQAVTEGANRYRKQVAATTKRGEGARVHAVEHSRAGWFQALRASIVRERIACRRFPDRYKRPYYAAKILELKASVLAAITVDAGLSRLLQDDGILTWTRFSYAIGNAVVAELNNNKVRKARSLQRMRSASRRLTPQRVTQWAKANLDDPEDSKKFALAVGDFLGMALLTTATVNDRDGRVYPAFKRYRAKRDGAKRPAWHVRLTDEAAATIASWHAAIQRQRPAHLPMVVQPMPWQESKTPLGKKIEGGRITANYPLVSKATRQQKEAYQHTDLTRTFEGLDAISATPGRVDPKVAVTIEHYAVAGGRLGMPRMSDDDAPPKPAEGSSEAVMAEWKAARRKWYRETIANASERENFAHSLTAMRTMQMLAREGFGRFWFDYFMDYRGRAYPRCSSYCPQQRDLWRASIHFADGKEPGEDGMRAIRIRAASLYGMDKLSLVEREAWTRDHEKDIARAAADPAAAYDFWSKADGGDAAWQFLQACFALNDAEAAAHYVIRLDGTANGYQHMAAMTLDEETAGKVNMVESTETDRPNKLYNDVAAVVARQVGLDALHDPVAALVAGRVTGSVVKQPVMTTQYDVTPAGMRSQLMDKLDFVPEDKVARVNAKGETVMVSQRWLAAVYLQKQIVAATEHLFPKPIALMRWFQTAADAFSERGELMRHTNEMGFPVVGRHVSTKTTQVRLATGMYDLRVQDPDAGVKTEKQRNTAATSVIHGNDAADMFLKGIRAVREGLSFWPNHDCYGTHAANWEAMSRLVREVFIETHADNIPTKLYHQWRGMGIDIPPPPALGSFDLNRVMASTYFVN